jgi:hypothetical protein
VLKLANILRYILTSQVSLLELKAGLTAPGGMPLPSPLELPTTAVFGTGAFGQQGKRSCRLACRACYLETLIWSVHSNNIPLILILSVHTGAISGSGSDTLIPPDLGR